MIEELQRRLDFIEWHDRIEVINKMVMAGEGVEMSRLEAVANEGTSKGWFNVVVAEGDEITRVRELHKGASALQKEIKAAIEGLESGRETWELVKIKEMAQRVVEIKVRIEEVKAITKVIE